MAGRQRIDRVRRQYNQWVANQTLEDYALRFTAKSARRWSAARVANTALGAISFLALEAIGGTITVNYGFTNAAAAILVVSVIIFACGLPIAYHAAKCGIDIDLLTRGAGFGYIGSTITSLIYASFTFIFFAIEAVILASALELCFGIPRPIGYLLSAVVIIPLVTHGITLISRFQLWTQPLWIVLHILPFAAIAYASRHSFAEWTQYSGDHGNPDGHLDLLLFGTAAAVVFSLVAQIGEQVDFLRFLPRDRRASKTSWWVALLSAGPGWIVLGALKLLAGSFLAYFALSHGVTSEHAAEPVFMYQEAFRYVLSQPDLALALTGTFVILSQLKINVTNAYAGSIAWSNFFSRLTHSHPGRVVWLVFNVVVALLLMELGVYKALEQTLALYSNVAIAWVGALVADLVINRPLGLRPQHMEFKRAHLYDINPVGVGAMTIATLVSVSAFYGLFGPVPKALAPFVALATALIVAPLIAWATGGKYYIARKPRRAWQTLPAIKCCICEHAFEPEDMASCPAYSGPICSLCCSLDARCHDLCKPHARTRGTGRNRVGQRIAGAGVRPDQLAVRAVYRPVCPVCGARRPDARADLSADRPLQDFGIIPGRNNGDNGQCDQCSDQRPLPASAAVSGVNIVHEKPPKKVLRSQPEERLAVIDGSAVFDQHIGHAPAFFDHHIVHQFHQLDVADDLAGSHGRGIGQRRFGVIKNADHRGCQQPCFLDHCLGFGGSRRGQAFQRENFRGSRHRERRG